MQPSELYQMWRRLVSQYSEKELSLWSDRLPALQGIAAALMRTWPAVLKTEDYVFGCWRPDIEQSLFWYRRGSTLRDKKVGETLRTYAPSWSWASCPTAIEYLDLKYFRNRVPVVSLIQVIDLFTKYVKPLETFGPGSGRLTLKGYLVPVEKSRGYAVQLIESSTTTTSISRFDFFRDFEASDGGGSDFEITSTKQTKKGKKGSTQDNHSGHSPSTCFMLPQDFAKDTKRWPAVNLQLDDLANTDAPARVTHMMPVLSRNNGDITQAIFLEPVEGENEQVFRRVGFTHTLLPSEVSGSNVMEKYSATVMLL
ncbi:hypothetical protein FSARC_13095 [Fusarium sarcochroum]|uniref:Uncharacterized protein n=1 Tax=Fusarium sarcochroum TaxID=1208366 RepID=A0A8H4T3Q8_9HYPO|nr:hypothetical protein FSARC_13095 [Fusarium sarcochroum]